MTDSWGACRCTQCGHSGQKDDSHLRQDELDSARFHHATHNVSQFKTYQLFNSGIFHWVFLDCGWSLATKTSEGESTDGRATVVKLITKVILDLLE